MKLKMEKDLIIKMIVAAVLGIILITSIFVALSLLNGDKNKEIKVPVVVLNEEEPLKVEETIEYDRILALVKIMNKEDGFMQVYDVEANINVTLNISSAVAFEDEYGTAIVMDQIIPGYLVNIKFNKATFIPDFVKVAPQIQIIKNLSSLEIDEILKTIQIGSDIYNFDDEMVALDGDESLVLTDLSIADDVVVRAYQGKIWSIIVENGHGYIILENYSAYLEGRLEIGNRTSYTIIKDMKVAVTVGVHTVIITKEEMTPYSASVFIEEGMDYIIDLSDLQPKVSEVVFTIVQENSILYINDEKIESFEEAIVLDYGQYAIRVENDGYMDWEGILVVDQPYLPQTIDMEIEPLYLHMTGPAGAEFYIDGVQQGVMKIGESIDVPIVPGGHILTLRKEGFISWSQSVFIDDAGEDYYYTVSELTEILTEPTTTPIPATTVTPEPGETPGDDVYGTDAEGVDGTAEETTDSD